MARVYVKGLPELRRVLKALPPEAKAAFKGLVKKHTRRARDGARRRVPVDSGELQSTIRDSTLAGGLIGRVDAGYGDLRRSRRSAKAVTSGKKGSDSSNEKGVYAMVIEFGDPKRNRPPQPYLFPAIEAVRPGFMAEARAEVGSLVRRHSTGEFT